LRRAIQGAREAGHLRADLEDEQMLFEIHGLILALHYEARFLQNPGSIARANAGFENILRRSGAATPATTKPSTKTVRPAKSAKE
jgi:hypothetical protein